MQEAGAFAVVLECVPHALAKRITEELDITTIGFGAGPDCDGQVLVYQDMIAMFSGFTPKFTKTFANVGEVMKEGFRAYIEEVQNGTFPEVPTHTFKMDESILDELK